MNMRDYDSPKFSTGTFAPHQPRTDFKQHVENLEKEEK